MRRALLAVTLVLLPALAAAQADATDAQLRLIDAYIAREVAVAGSGATSPHDEVNVLSARQHLDAALARGERVDLARVRAAVEARLADIEERLAEVGRTCGPVPDLAPARALRDALLAVRTALSRGPFLAR